MVDFSRCILLFARRWWTLVAKWWTFDSFKVDYSRYFCGLWSFYWWTLVPS